MTSEIKFPSPSDGNGCLTAPLALTTWRRLAYAVLVGSAYGVLWPAITSLLRYPA